MFNKFSEQLNNQNNILKNKGDNQEQFSGEKSKLGNFQQFMESLIENAEKVQPEDILHTLNYLEKYSKTPYRKVETYTDPKLDTFCCAEIPSKTVDLEGNIVDDLQKKQYLIGVPFLFVAGKASAKFLRGELDHELGHASKTDFSRLVRLIKLAKIKKYDPKDFLDLDNVIEDPRMERLVGGRLHPKEDEELFEKNRLMMIPNLASDIQEGKLSLKDQFIFIIKLEALWRLHQKDLEGEQQPWNLDNLNPDVKEAYLKIEPTLKQITGSYQQPAMKKNKEVEKLIIDKIIPVFETILDKQKEIDKNSPENKEGQEGDNSENKEGQEGDNSEGNKPGSDQGNPVWGSPPLDPGNVSSWPPELQKFFKKMLQQHQQKLEQESQKQKERQEESQDKQEKLKQETHQLKKQKDGFEDIKSREKYGELRQEVLPVTRQLKRIFQRFLPKIDEPQYEYGRKGIKFDVKRYIKKINTGQEKPLGRRRTPERNALLLQLLIDVSGSMYLHGERISNAVKAVISICEAAQDYNIDIEILASDDGNAETDKEYIIKAFEQKFDGKTKTNIIKMLDNSGGENEDGQAILVALKRLKSKMIKTKNKFDRIASLMVFISDSTTQDADTLKAATEARHFTSLEGTAITPENDIPEKVKYNFGPDSLVPKNVEDFPFIIQQILKRHISRLKPKE